jgi:serine/threonine protein kinase
MLIEYVEGTTLTEWLNNNPSTDERKRIVRELNDGLNYIHSKLISHYDIKSDNIFVPFDSSRPPFYIDFGSSGRREINNNSWKSQMSYNRTQLSSLINTIIPHNSNSSNKLGGGKHRRFSNRKNNRRKITIKTKRVRKL